MKKILCVVLLFTLVSCRPTIIRGFVVAKEYVPQHMDDVQVEPVVEASVVPHITPHPVVVPHRHIPVLVPAKFVLYIADRYSVHDVDVDSVTFIKTKVGQRMTIEY